MSNTGGKVTICSNSGSNDRDTDDMDSKGIVQDTGANKPTEGNSICKRKNTFFQRVKAKLRDERQRKKLELSRKNALTHNFQCGLPMSHFLTHFPKEPSCPTCQSCKAYKRPRRKRGKLEDWKIPKTFGESTTGDHMIIPSGQRSRHGHTACFVIVDIATQWLQAFPQKRKAAPENQVSLRKYFGSVTPVRFYSDGSGEIDLACREMGCNWPHDVSCPHRPETNGVAEYSVKRVKEGASCALAHARLPVSFWSDAVRCYSFLRNISDELEDGLTPYERRFGESFKGRLVPFGAAVWYVPLADREVNRLDKFGETTRPALFMGYKQHEGGK